MDRGAADGQKNRPEGLEVEGNDAFEKIAPKGAQVVAQVRRWIRISQA